MRQSGTSILVLALLCLASCSSSSSSSSDMAEPGRGESLVFEAKHDFDIDVPEGAGLLRAWFAVPSDRDPDQEILSFESFAPYPTRQVRDERGNNFLFMEVVNPPAGRLEVLERFRLERREVLATLDPSLTRPHDAEELVEFAADLEGSSQSVIDDDVRAMAAAAVGAETNPILVARLLYDAVLERVEYHVKDPKPDAEKTMQASGTGSSRYTFEKCTGNCTDFHSLYAALARSRNLPVRAVYGSFFKGPLDGVDQDQSYHCWIEFHAPNIGWIPLDVAVADVFTADFEANEFSRPRAELTVADGYDGPDARLVDYYFGNIDARRVVWHRGRDLVMRDPRQEGGPLLWNPKAYVEIDGKPAKVGRKLSYRSVED
ncbi:MAG: transglutaminase domain-containing protein [Planctomycetes bacterium]|nr:transglutaminase domain-containing protein [Planctomycetota bacterium]